MTRAAFSSSRQSISHALESTRIPPPETRLSKSSKSERMPAPPRYAPSQSPMHTTSPNRPCPTIAAPASVHRPPRKQNPPSATAQQSATSTIQQERTAQFSSLPFLPPTAPRSLHKNPLSAPRAASKVPPASARTPPANQPPQSKQISTSTITVLRRLSPIANPFSNLN